MVAIRNRWFEKIYYTQVPSHHIRDIRFMASASSWKRDVQAEPGDRKTPDASHRMLRVGCGIVCSDFHRTLPPRSTKPPSTRIRPRYAASANERPWQLDFSQYNSGATILRRVVATQACGFCSTRVAPW